MHIPGPRCRARAADFDKRAAELNDLAADVAVVDDIGELIRRKTLALFVNQHGLSDSAHGQRP
ncbi:hypothetical protein VD0002_g10173 [Verticillium dahliae]|nr:hypothetical protein VD0003_g9943 [Verticillium dahliae]PNH52491.1 hypothetical protein VD0002_g10173 [Verticillium dahliae]